ncbi:hypothetical protein [Lichenicoccus sp.]|uniref:hypothetical protein n=1 Tax=Lichenicoccus sp. TaxID=2781899 RepID=UPI003D12B4EA
MTRALLIVFTLAALCPFAYAKRLPLFAITFPNMAKHSSLMGFELTIVSGRVAALRDCPAGWQIEVDNDAAWHATIRAHATVGAAALDASALRSLVLFSPAPAAVTSMVAGKFSVAGIVTVMRDGNLTQLPLNGLRLLAVSRHP